MFAINKNHYWQFKNSVGQIEWPGASPHGSNAQKNNSPRVDMSVHMDSLVILTPSRPICGSNTQKTRVRG